MYNNANKQNLYTPNLQRINLSGAILGTDDILDKIQKAKNNKNIKGVLVVVNSPGGAVAPSIEIAMALKELREIKPVIAYASGVMASGSYWASIWTNKIIANKGSMIGSIGVIMQSVDASVLIDNLGLKIQTIKAGKYKEVGTPTRAWTKIEKDELNKVIQSTYNMFVKDVSIARKLDPQNHTVFANAHIFTASQAQKVGLIDEVSNLTNAKKQLQILAKVKKPLWAKKDKFDRLFDKIINTSLNSIVSKTNTLIAF
jgi:protease-4